MADHRAGLGMPRRAKVIALSMWAAIVLSGLALRARWPVVALGQAGTLYILLRVGPPGSGCSASAEPGS